jgi:hypothetical protein
VPNVTDNPADPLHAVLLTACERLTVAERKHLAKVSLAELMEDA